MSAILRNDRRRKNAESDRGSFSGIKRARPGSSSGGAFESITEKKNPGNNRKTPKMLRS